MEKTTEMKKKANEESEREAKLCQGAMWKLVSLMLLLFVISQLNNTRSAFYKHIRLQKEEALPVTPHIYHRRNFN